jgi:hypothetical protein
VRSNVIPESRRESAETREMKLSAYVLIGELLADPAKFKQRGKSEELFQGHSDRLNPERGMRM